MSLELRGGQIADPTSILVLIGIPKVNPNIFPSSFSEKLESLLGLKLLLNPRIRELGISWFVSIGVNSLELMTNVWTNYRVYDVRLSQGMFTWLCGSRELESSLWACVL